jgi:PTS system nitrogen regulatory IIA component
MPREQMNEKQLAAYLHLDVREVVKLASRGRIPCRKVAGGYVFFKGQIDHWIFEQMGDLSPDQLAKIEKGVSDHHGWATEADLLGALIPAGGIAVPLPARTRQSVLRELVAVAEEAGLVYNRPDLLDELQQREELCSTAVFPGVAMPHPRHPVPYDIAETFIVVGLTESGIPFGATDGALTRLFFLICSKDDRTHLHVLARLAQVLHEPDAKDRLLACSDADALRECLHALEAKVGLA